MKTKQLLAMAVGALAASAAGLASGGVVSAQDDVPDPASYPPALVEVGTLGPTCVSGVPHIAYDISVVSTIGEPLDAGSLTANLTFLDANGKKVLELAGQPLSGVVLWPGASVDPIDWPGWKNGSNGWESDSSDAVLRRPLTLNVVVGEARGGGTVAYPEDDTGCANAEVLPPATTTTLASRIPDTGSDGVGQSLMIGATIAVAGVGLLLVSRRRRHDALAVA